MHNEGYEIVIRLGPAWYTTAWFILIIIVLFAVLLAISIKHRGKKIRRKETEKRKILQEAADMEMTALQSQMNPHFIFNAINSIQSYILSNDIDQALHYLTLFSRLIRKTLENATKEMIPLIEEMEYIKFYLEIEKMRFDDLFNYELTVSPDASFETTLIPPMIIQPFIENAIKHGIMNKGDNGLLKIEFSVPDERTLRCIIEDNGVGRVKSAEIEERTRRSHTSKGMSLVKNRLSSLNQKYKTDKFRLHIYDLADETGMANGTRVEVELLFIG
jgi:LytS/YehU family sensor histidine kinase